MVIMIYFIPVDLIKIASHRPVCSSNHQFCYVVAFEVAAYEAEAHFPFDARTLQPVYAFLRLPNLKKSLYCIFKFTFAVHFNEQNHFRRLSTVI